MNLEQFMRDNGIERITYRAPTDLLPDESFHVRLHGWLLSEHIGRGATVAEAYQDALERQDITIDNLRKVA